MARAVRVSGVSGLTLDDGGRGTQRRRISIRTSREQFSSSARAQPQANTLFSGGKTALTTNTNEYDFTTTRDL